MADTSALTIATNIFTAPGEAFAAIKERPSPWLPLLLVLLGYCAVTYFYMSAVDFPWLMDRQLQSADLTDEQRAQTVDAMGQVPPAALAVGSAIVTCIGILIVFAIIALYYTGVSFATRTGVKFKQWFALSWWCALPIVLGLLATLVNVLTGDMRFVVQEAINPLSFGNLLGIDVASAATTVERTLLSLDPTTLWTLVLSILGYQALSQKSIVHATVVVLAPYGLIVLISVLGSLL
jgi:hypothetical protein